MILNKQAQDITIEINNYNMLNVILDGGCKKLIFLLYACAWKFNFKTWEKFPFWVN